jgi:uncharacterized protein YndB with AHSA1/START domain
MNRTITPAPVRRSIEVAAPPDRAFAVFTRDIGLWWPHTHKLGPAALETIIVEPRAGGRWFERDVDGSECDIGHVLVWEPPSRLVLAWQLTPEWKFDPDLVTEVEVRFTPIGERATRVELEHRNLERMGERADAMRQQIDAPNGWPGLLQQFADLCNQKESNP